MILAENNFYQNISKIEKELKKYDSFSRIDLFNYCIDTRLKNTLLTYNEQMNRSTEFLETRNSAKVLKTLSKMQKREDKDVIEANLNKKESE